ncbi:MAG: restriction endonuclease subunit R [Cyanobacteriota bacterium]|nr:restriction endonuclease subunit R [Cyanobacteriota bacterium]
MVQTLRAKEMDLRYLIDTFGLQFIRDEQFFREWQENLPQLTDLQKQLLDRVREGYFNLLEYPPMLENTVRMAVFDPILFIGGFYLAPFHVKSEEPVELVEEDDGVLVRGRIDTLVLKDRLWVMTIESKKAAFSVEEGLAQILAYMLGNPNPERPSYGLIVTGGSFVFLKLVQGEIPRYATSKVFVARNPEENELYEVLRILKHLNRITLNVK